MTSTITCVNAGSQPVDDTNCLVAMRPPSTAPCNTQPCAATGANGPTSSSSSTGTTGGQAAAGGASGGSDSTTDAGDNSDSKQTIIIVVSIVGGVAAVVTGAALLYYLHARKTAQLDQQKMVGLSDIPAQLNA